MNENVLNEVSINSFTANLEVSDTVNEGEIVVKNGHSPYIGSNGNWYEWDDTTEQYTDTGVKAEGPKGDPGEPGAPGSDYVLTNQDKQDIAAIVDAEAVKYVSQTLTDAQKTQARANIGAASLSDLGTVFTLKGGVATVSDLPASGNNIGDVYYVENLSAGFIWITSTAYPNGYWEELGETIDLSNYIEKPTGATSGQFLQWNGTTWVSANIPAELPNVLTTDAGKVLTVNASGEWEAETIETETPKITTSLASVSLDPNKFYVFPEMAALTVSFASPSRNDIVNEYHFRFTSGSTATVLTLPSGVVEPDGFSVEANMVYEVSIIDNYMLAVSWGVSA